MSKKAYSKKKELTPGKILILVAIAALVIYFGTTFPKSIVAYTPDDILTYSIKYISDISTGETDGYKTGSYAATDLAAVALSEALDARMYRRQLFGIGNNTVDAEGMVEVLLVSSDGDWFTLRCYSDGTVMIQSPGEEDFKAYRSGWGFGRNGQQLFRELLQVFAD